MYMPGEIVAAETRAQGMAAGDVMASIGAERAALQDANARRARRDGAIVLAVSATAALVVGDTMDGLLAGLGVLLTGLLAFLVRRDQDMRTLARLDRRALHEIQRFGMTLEQWHNGDTPGGAWMPPARRHQEPGAPG